MKLVIVTENGYNLDCSELSNGAEVSTFSLMDSEKHLLKYKSDLMKITEIHVVGFDIEGVSMAVFGMMENPETLMELFDLEEGQLPKFKVILSRDVPKLKTGDMVATPIIGGNVAVLRVNYNPTYDLAKLIETSLLYAHRINERCVLTTPKGEVKFIPCSENPEMAFLKLPNHERPVLVNGDNARLYGLQGYLSGVVQQNIRKDIAKKSKIHNKSLDVTHDELLELAKLTMNEEGCKNKFHNDLIGMAGVLEWPYNNNYWRGVRRGVLLDVKDKLREYNLL